MLLLNSTAFATQYPSVVNQSPADSLIFTRPEFEGMQSKVFDDSARFSLFNNQLHMMFTYDDETLRDQAFPVSIFTHYRSSLFVPGLLNENIANFDESTPSNMVNRQEDIHDDQSGLNALHLPQSFEFISFNALVKEHSSTNNLAVEVQDKIETGDIYAQKYYPMRNKFTDHGHILNLEARIKLPVMSEHRNELLQLIIFVDTSPITMEQNTWASELNQTTINGAGLGINWTYTGNFALQAYVANELEYQVLAIPPALSQLFWVQAIKYF